MTQDVDEVLEGGLHLLPPRLQVFRCDVNESSFQHYRACGNTGEAADNEVEVDAEPVGAHGTPEVTHLLSRLRPDATDVGEGQVGLGQRRARLVHPVEDLDHFTPEAGQWGVRTVNAQEFITRGADPVVAVDQLPLTGRHNLANALAACAMADAVDAPTAAMQQGLLAFHGLPHRMQTVPTADGICWIDDSKATNEAAAIASIRSVTGPLVLIAGGDAKGAGFSQLATALAERECTAVLLGRDADFLANALSGACTVQRVDSLAEAVKTAARIAVPGSTVLLAPACSSHDMFADFADRGQQFTAAVRELAR